MAGLLGLFVLILTGTSAGAQGAYVRSGGYNSDCMVRPNMLRANFEKSSFVKSEFERPVYLRREVVPQKYERLDFVHTEMIRPQFVRPEFHRCTETEKKRSGIYRAAGFSTAPGLVHDEQGLPAVVSMAPAVKVPPTSEVDCCSGPLFTPSASAQAAR